MQMEEKNLCLEVIREGRVCDCCSQRYWCLKGGNLLTKKVSSIIATRDGTEKNSSSGTLQNTLPKISKLSKCEVTSYC